MNQNEYRNYPAVNQSSLKVLAESPELYYGRFIAKSIPERPPTAAMKFGTAVENYLRTGSHGFVKLPDDIKARRGKEYEAWKATIDPELQVVPKGEWDELRLDDLEKVGRNIREHPRAEQLIAEGEWHKRLFWTDGEYKQECKAELDLVWQERAIVDLKTAADTTPTGFARQAVNLGYDVQAAWYRDGYRMNSGGLTLPFIFIVVKNAEPYNVETYTLSDAFMLRGSERAAALLSELERRMESQNWRTDTHGTIATIEPPRWALTQETFQWS